MNEAIIYQYLQPLTYVMLTLGFGFIWYNIRGLTAAGHFAFAFLFGSLAALLEILRDSMGAQVAGFAILAAYTATACLVTTGLFVRAREPLPIKPIAGVLAALFCSFTFFWYVYESIAMRMLMANVLNAAIVAMPLTFLRYRQHILIDRILFWLLAIIAAQILIRTVGTLYVDWNTLDITNYASSLVGISLRFTTALAGIGLAVTLYVALGIDIVYELRMLSLTDKMTGLRNRAGFEEKARRMIAQAAEKRLPVCLIITDLDRFKQVNDTFGHSTGDAVISFFGRILGNMARKTDLAARVGGEEFCVLLYDCTIDDATDLTEAVREAFCQTPVPGVTPELKCSASFGIALLRGNEGLSDFYKRADEALYQAKETGRNRVFTIDNYNWRPPLETPPPQPELVRRAGDRVPA